MALLIGESAIKRREHFAAFHFFFCLLCAMSELDERGEADVENYFELIQINRPWGFGFLVFIFPQK